MNTKHSSSPTKLWQSENVRSGVHSSSRIAPLCRCGDNTALRRATTEKNYGRNVEHCCLSKDKVVRSASYCIHLIQYFLIDLASLGKMNVSYSWRKGKKMKKVQQFLRRRTLTKFCEGDFEPLSNTMSACKEEEEKCQFTCHLTQINGRWRPINGRTNMVAF
ncbi:unnamed protein product [Vicia faba]|uniref:Uncharacterized protein n=1 Tax=Vicia faba TaxID=3906 RepID=A0AAV1AEZ2_VICFA|nr:unnamed protein product [Vicia faba]